MKMRLAVAMVGVLLAGASVSAMGQEAGSLYKVKCAVCHGDQGQGKPKLGAKLAGTSKTDAQIVALLTKGGGAKAPHLKPISGLTPEQAKSVAEFVKGLK
jgi:mono/diheme cytochrome c family protein